MSDLWNRREFIRRMATLSAAGVALGLTGCGSSEPEAPAAPTAAAAQPTAQAAAKEPAAPAPTEAPVAPAEAAPAQPASSADLIVARGPNADPAELVRRAIAALGGIERFVKKGDDVIIKPNICNAYNTFEYASTTNPEVVSAIVALCLGAGAKRVRIMDDPFGGTPQTAYERSGIGAAVGRAGGVMEVMSPIKFVDTPIPQGKSIKKWGIYPDLLAADVVINVPIAKHHGLTGLTLGLKNLMGIVENRGALHMSIHQRLADLATVIRPQLTIVDAVRILTANGPTGGNLDDVKKLDTIIASADLVAADAYATTLFGRQPSDIPYIQAAFEQGLGQMDLKAIRIEEIAV